MYRLQYRVSQMDCPSEEILIREQLADLPDIAALEFDLAARELTVYSRSMQENLISQRLAALNLGSNFLHVTENADDILPDNRQAEERRVLIIVLLINAFFFIAEGIFGWLSDSMGLMADALDMLADSLVYALSLLAVGTTVLFKQRIATIAGWLQIYLAVYGLFEVLRRVLRGEAMPDFRVMIALSLLALVGNILCLWLLQRQRSQEAHMQASMIFTANDVLINLGVMLSALAVWLTGSRFPDLLIGTIVFILVLRGARRILLLGKAPACACHNNSSAS